MPVPILLKGIPVRPLKLVLLMSFFLLLTPVQAEAQPQQWELLQNDPNPFCGVTIIGFQVPQAAEITLAVLSPDSTMGVKTLAAGLFSAGYHTLVWDQTDESGIPVPDGDYPYFMEARLPELKGILFESGLIATVSCEVPVVLESWGRVKSRYLF